MVSQKTPPFDFLCNHGFKVGGPSAEGTSRVEVPMGENLRRRGGGAWRGLPTGGGVWRGGCAPSPENFLIFYLKMVSFGAFWVALPRCMLFRATAQKSEAEEEGREKALVKNDILH